MKHLFLLITTIFFLTACKSDQKKEQEATPEVKELTVAQKIANAHGFANWDKVSKINFVFNVDRGDNHFEREWQWQPKTNVVTMISKTDTISYNRMQMDSTIMKTDSGFINDKFWLLVPFNLVWDEGIEISEATKEEAPISKTILNKITLTYTGDGGYTPGDAYDFYYTEGFFISEWVFRKSNAAEPSLITTFDDYKDFNGIKISTSRMNGDKSAKFYFTGVNVSNE